MSTASSPRTVFPWLDFLYNFYAERSERFWDFSVLSEMCCYCQVWGAHPERGNPRHTPKFFPNLPHFSYFDFFGYKKRSRDTGSVCVDFLYIKLFILYHSSIYLSRTFVRNMFSGHFVHFPNVRKAYFGRLRTCGCG